METSHIQRNIVNGIDERFGVFFMERMHPGAPRWFGNELFEGQHAFDHTGTDRAEYARPSSVRDAMRNCHRADPLRPGTHDWWQGTCMNPDCPEREQWGIQGPDLQRDISKHGDALRTRIDKGLRRMATSAKPDPGDPLHNCTSCGKPTHTFPVRLIRDKWVYVLKQSGDSISYYAEVHMEDTGAGTVHLIRKKGKNRYHRYKEKPFGATLGLRPDPAAFVWHFFLSPVRLGKRAMQVLEQAVKSPTEALESGVHARAIAAGLGHEFMDISLQPWASVVTMKYSQERLQNDGFELGKYDIWEAIPLVDPFAWAAQAVETDYLPVLSAQLDMLRDPDEQAKAFVAAALEQAMGLTVTDPNAHPPKTAPDVWEIGEETTTPDGEFGRNAADAWINRYRKTLSFLTDETNAACARVILPLKYSLAHRIVELGCQAPDEDFALAYGMAHWHHVLQQMPACEEGKNFLDWLTSAAEATHPELAAGGRLPTLNVLHGIGIEDNAELADTVRGLSAQLYATLAPAVIGRTSSDDSAADVVAGQLSRLGVPVTSVGGKDVIATSKWALSIPDVLLENYAERAVGALGRDSMLEELKVTTIKERLQGFRTLGDYHSALTLLLAVFEYGKSARTDATNFDRYSSTKAMIKTPIDVAGFAAKNARTILKARMSSETLAIIESAEVLTPEIETVLMKNGHRELLASRSVRAYSLLGKVTRGIAGPVGLVLGGCDMVMRYQATEGKWDGGETGAAIGEGIQLVGTAMVVAVAAAETVALLSGAATAAWAGPVGWIAAGLILIGAVVVHIWSKNDLQIFASHCFLGNDYGRGDFKDKTGRAWMGGKPWPHLRYESAGKESAARYRRQQLALLRLMSSYKTWWGPQISPDTSGQLPPEAGLEIFPGHLGEDSRFEVTIDIRHAGKVSPVESYTADVWPLARQLHWIGAEPKNGGWVRFFPETGPTVDMFQVYVEPRSTEPDYWIETRVRLRMESVAAYLPASRSSVYNGNFVKGKEIGGLIFQRYANSADVD